MTEGIGFNLRAGRLLFALAFVMLPSSTIAVADTNYPAGAMVKNAVSDFGAVGDGITDNTLALQTAMNHTIGNGGRILLIPAGTYLVSGTLYWKDTLGRWDSKLTLQGAGQGMTIIKLANSTPAYGLASSPKAVVYTASNNPLTPVDGGGYNGFRNYIRDLTIDTGIGNPGAIGIDFNGTNRAGIYDVTIVSSDPQRSGVAGISMRRYASGPCVFRSVSVTGFDVGIDVSCSEYSQSYINVTVSNQHIAGIRNSSNIITLVGLTSSQAAKVPAISVTSSAALTTVLGANLAGTAGGTAISLIGSYYVDESVASGYDRLVTGHTGLANLPGIPIYSPDPSNHGAPYTLFSTATKSLGLEARDTPPDFQEPLEDNWVSVLDFGAICLPTNATYHPATNDSTAGIQAAIDYAASAGKTVVCFPFGYYYVSGTITVHGTVRRLAFLESEIWPEGPNFANALNPQVMFRFSGTVDCQWDGLDTGSYVQGHPGLVWIEHNSSSALTLKHCEVETTSYHRAYRNTAAGTGDLYLEDVESTQGSFGWDFCFPQNVWAISFDEETSGGTHLHIGPGVQARIIGFKTESGYNQAIIDAGGSLEIMGGLMYPLARPNLAYAAFLNSGQFSFILATSAYGSTANDFKYFVAETRGGVTEILPKTSVAKRGLGSRISLYVGY